MKKIITLVLISLSLSTLAFCQYPAKIQPVLWLNAGHGAETADNVPAENGDPVMFWKDQSGNNIHPSQTNSLLRPIFSNDPASLINFNPVIQFADSDILPTSTQNDLFLSLINPANLDFSFFAVLKTTDTTSYGFFYRQPLIYGGDFNQIGKTDMCISLSNNHSIKIGGGSSLDFDLSANQPVNTGIPTLIQVSREIINSPNTSKFSHSINGNGYTEQTINHLNNAIETSTLCRIGKNRYPPNSGTHKAFDGSIAEIIVYDYNLTELERQKVSSYLAIKYGISLTHNYLNSTGDIIYELDHYRSNIAGVAYDKEGKLLQLKSSNNAKLYPINIQLSEHKNAFRNQVEPSSFIIGEKSELNEPNQSVKVQWNGQEVLKEWKIQKKNFKHSVILWIALPENLEKYKDQLALIICDIDKNCIRTIPKLRFNENLCIYLNESDLSSISENGTAYLKLRLKSIDDVVNLK